MPTPRSQLPYRTVACDGGVYAHSDAGPTILSHGPLDLLGLARQRISQLEMEIAESSHKLSICEQQAQAAIEVAQRQNELVLVNAQKEVAHMAKQLIEAQGNLRTLTERSQSAQHALIHEVNDLAHSVVRLDTQIVLQDSTKITVNELDAQLEWHRRWSGEAIPRSGKKKIKIQRWVRAVEFFKSELQARLDGIHATVSDNAEQDEAGGEGSDAVEESVVDLMDVD